MTGEAKKAGKKVLGAAALGAGIGGMIDGGEGAAWGAGAGAVVGVAAAKIVPGQPGGRRRGHGPRVPPGPPAQRRHRRLGVGEKTVLRLAPFLLALLAVPVGAQVATDRVTGGADKRAVAAATGGGVDASVASLVPYAGRRVSAIVITGNNVTKDWVITREIQTKLGDPLEVEAVARDVARLDNLSIFAEIRVDGVPVGDDGVRLVFNFKEMPSWFPILSYVYTEENGLSWGLGVSAGNLAGRDLSASARVYFGDLEQQWSRISWPWISGNHRSFDFYGARYTRPDELRGFEETSYEFTPELGTWIGDHGWARAKFSYFEMKSDTAGITLSPDNEDQLLRLGAAFGWDTRDSWRNPRRGSQSEIELWRTGGFLGGDGDWWSVNLDLRRWLPVTRRTKLMLSGLVSLQSGTLGEDVPVYLNYFMGGANSIRGYGVTDLGEEPLRQEPDAGHGRVLVHRDPAAALGHLEDLAPARGGARRVRRRGHRLDRVARPRHAARPRWPRRRRAPAGAGLGDGAARRGLEPRLRLPLPLRERDEAQGPARAVALVPIARLPCKLARRPSTRRSHCCPEREALVMRAGCALPCAVALAAAIASPDEPAPRATSSATESQTRTVVAGKEFGRGGKWRYWFGDGYRKAWTTPVELPVLDLATEAGGLTPLVQVGGFQTEGLAMKGADGRGYTFRKLEKHPERVLPKEWQDSELRAIAIDQTAAAHPAATAIIGSLAQSVGIPFYGSRLAVMPDDPALGKFREVFGGTVGTFDEYITPGYEGITEIVSSFDLWQKWREGGPQNRVDSRAFLKARLFDLVVGNWDRHQGQWRWARIPGRPLWVPLPEDADQAFTRYEGKAMGAVRNVVPRFMRYSGEYPKRMEGLTTNNYDVTRWLLADVEWPVYEEVARELAAQMTDAAIDAAMHQMPPAWYAIDGAQMTKDLRQRRDGIAAFARRFYLHLADRVDVRGSDRADLAERAALRRRLAGADAVAARRRWRRGRALLPAPLRKRRDAGDPPVPARRRRPPGHEPGRARAASTCACSAARATTRSTTRRAAALDIQDAQRRQHVPARAGDEGRRERVEEPGAREGPALARAAQLRPLDGADGPGLLAAEPGIHGRRRLDAHGVGLPQVPVGQHAGVHAAVLERLQQRPRELRRAVAAQRHEAARLGQPALLRDREPQLLRLRERDARRPGEGAAHDRHQRVLGLPRASLPGELGFRAARRGRGEGASRRRAATAWSSSSRCTAAGRSARRRCASGSSTTRGAAASA